MVRYRNFFRLSYLFIFACAGLQAKQYDLAYIKELGLDRVRVTHCKPTGLSRFFGKKVISPQKFFEMMGLVYIRENFVKDVEILQENQSNTTYYQEKVEHHADLFKQYALDVLQANNAPVEIRWVNSNVGFGVFANQDIVENQFIQVYTGQIVYTEDMRQHGSDYSWKYPTAVQGEAVSLDAYFAGNEMRYVNHGEQPNVIMKNVLVNNMWHACYIASRPIQKGEQLLVSYGSGYWRNRQDIYEKL